MINYDLELRSCLEQQPDHRWAKNQADALRAELAGTSVGNAYEDQLAKDELAIVLAELKHREMFKMCKRMNDEQLRARSAEKRASLEETKEQGAGLIDAWWAETLPGLALRKTELLGDLRWIVAQGSTCESTEQHVHEGRQSRQEARIKDWEEKRTMIEGRIEMKLTETILERRAKLAHIRCVECKVYEDPEHFRREDDGHIARMKRCLACEFPHCETCGRQRTMSEGPVLVREKEAQADDRKEEGPWHQTKTRRPNRPSDP
jgi:hypothetical protein